MSRALLAIVVLVAASALAGCSGAPEEEGAERIPGLAESAPHRFSFGRAALRATIVSAVLFGLFYANYLYGWIGAEDLDWMH